MKKKIFACLLMAAMVLNGLAVTNVTKVKAANKKWTATYKGGAYDNGYRQYGFTWAIKNNTKSDVYVDDICLKNSSGKKIATWGATTINASKTLNKTYTLDFSKLSTGYYQFFFTMYDNKNHKKAKKETFSTKKMYHNNKRIRFEKLSSQYNKKTKLRTYTTLFRLTELKGKKVSFKIYNSNGKCLTTVNCKEIVPSKDVNYFCNWDGKVNNKQHKNGDEYNLTITPTN